MTLTRRHALSLLVSAPLAVSFSMPALAAQPNVFATDGTAINGMDPLEYFKSGAPVLGNPQLVHYFKEGKYLFATMKNMQKFAENPAKYVPQYGGYCAYAMAKGAIASTVPEAFSIYKGKLYLNQSLAVRETWNQDKAGYIKAANKNWPKFLS